MKKDRLLKTCLLVNLVGRAGIEPATHGLHTTLAFASRQNFRRCSLDYLIARLFQGLGVRRIVSEGFQERERQYLAGKMLSKRRRSNSRVAC